MSFLSGLEKFTGNVGRGIEDYYTLGGTELWRKFGGDAAKKILNPTALGLGSAWEAIPAVAGGMYMGGAGAAGASAGGMGAGGSGAGAGVGAAGMGAPNMAAAGSTLGAGGASSPLSLGGYGSSAGAGMGGGPPTVAGATPVSKALNMMRMGQGGGGGQQQAPQQDPRQAMMQKIYAMYPQLGGQNGLR